MSPKVLEAGELIIWFHSYDARFETRASVHIGKGSQDDHNDTKVWLEPDVEIARTGRILRKSELNRAVKLVEQNREFLLEAWHEYRRRASR